MKPYPVGCGHTDDQVNIGYYPAHTLAATKLLVGPDADAFAVDVVPAGKRVGMQSLRNPQRSPTPRLNMQPGDAFVWCWVLDGGKSGFIAREDLADGWESVPPWPHGRGPAQRDFLVGFDRGPRERRRPRFRIGRRAEGPREVTARELYFRYSAKGIAHHYLVAGDLVELAWSKPGWRCVRVIRARYLEAGATGYVKSAGLRA